MGSSNARDSHPERTVMASTRSYISRLVPLTASNVTNFSTSKQGVAQLLRYLPGKNLIALKPGFYSRQMECYPILHYLFMQAFAWCLLDESILFTCECCLPARCRFSTLSSTNAANTKSRTTMQVSVPPKVADESHSSPRQEALFQFSLVF